MDEISLKSKQINYNVIYQSIKKRDEENQGKIKNTYMDE